MSGGRFSRRGGALGLLCGGLCAVLLSSCGVAAKQPNSSAASAPPGARAASIGATEGSGQSTRVGSAVKRPPLNPLQEQFSEEELQRLADKKTVKRMFKLIVNKKEYRAGLSYRLVQARPMDIMRALREPGGIRRAIPYGLEATTLHEKDGVAQVRIVQGKTPIVGGYTVRLEWDLSKYQARFWMDPNEEHDIQDIWGAFGAREVAPGWTLVSFAFCFDLGGVGELLEAQAQKWATSTSNRIAKLVEPEESEEK